MEDNCSLCNRTFYTLKREKGNSFNKGFGYEQKELSKEELFDLSLYKKYIKLGETLIEEDAFKLLLYSIEKPKEFEEVYKKVEKEHRRKKLIL